MAPPTRVVYPLNSIAMGGMEMHVETLARAVASHGLQVSVILPELPELNEMAARLHAGVSPRPG